MTNGTIFVSISAVEDHHLVKTIQDCLNTATHPEKISFGISLQYRSNPNLLFFKNKIQTISYDPGTDPSEAPGVIQIRSEIKNLIDKEEYFLQVGPNTSFESGWDSDLISDLEDLSQQKNKTIISWQLSEKPHKNQYTQVYIGQEYHYQIDSYGLDIFGKTKEDLTNTVIKNKMVNQSYFSNNYLSNSLIFCKVSSLKDIAFPPYHKFSFEEIELSLIAYCNGYSIVSPVKEKIKIFSVGQKQSAAGWIKVGETLIEKKDFDNKKDFLQVCSLILNGKNDYIDINNLEKSLDSFYIEAKCYEEFQKEKEFYNNTYNKTPLSKNNGPLTTVLLGQEVEILPDGISQTSWEKNNLRIGLAPNLKNISPLSNVPKNKNEQNCLLFSGCSITAGDGLGKEDIWPDKLFKKILLSANGKVENYFNVARSGNSITESIDQIFKYCYSFGNPKAIFVLFPSIDRDLKYVHGEDLSKKINNNLKITIADSLNALVYKSYFYLEMFCRSNNILLLSASWSKDAHKIDINFENNDKELDSTHMIPGWRAQLNPPLSREFSADVLSNFDTFLSYSQERMNEEVLRYHMSKSKSEKKTSLIAKDGSHPGTSFHDFWAELFYKKYEKRMML